MLTRLLKDRSGATAIEYCMIASFIAMAIIAALTSLGIELESIFVAVDAGFAGAQP
jgi:pilus assembly protein Flp/PilA